MGGTEEIRVHKAHNAAIIGGIVAGLASTLMLTAIFYVLWRTRKTKTSLPISRTSTLMRQSNSTQTASNYDGNPRMLRSSMGRTTTMSSMKLSTLTEELPSSRLPVSPGRTTPVSSSVTATAVDEK